ncbi:dihydroxyacetone kinase subunit DhaL [Streptomyces subrutilus]|uniref:Dihydroxyacetone kinase subunit L n=1 Tax=Streptomyces subrutilus TaxID=36818 RepID=A0A5P2UQZ0_9ACTN|nr:dihydroxyacetone kinase subunit DhaL [Streptomyces subrutilus]QEU81756.1 dihydroxyacetone kinase subunit L [Streptomyces subrutilus]WSJ28813.1 dihydroxyacetone kinase subunit DhaL [Streptomyces subrutilus]GGZ93298.1 dihydroxyacetone kinase subunit L [Streptomyces subrutilus]
MTTPSTSAGDLAFVVRTIARTAVDHEQDFGDLDAVAGDGDFGFSLARGFEIVLADWDTLDADTPPEFLKRVAVVISKRVGGTSGPLWGTAFLRAAGVVTDRSELDASDAVAMLRAAAEGIKARGRSDLGDKTLLDALIPMTDALERRLADGEPPASAAELAALAAATARTAADATTPMQARRGRQSYTGERSIGSPDPGAVAVAVMAERVAAEWEGHD